MGSDLKKQLSKKISARKGKSKVDVPKRKKKAKSKKNSVQFSRYIFRVLKSVAPTESITKKSMNIMESFMFDIYDRITSQLHLLVKQKNGKTVSSKDIQAAAKLILPGELATHAVNNGIAAVKHYLEL